ncbi:pyruvate dehydrogenase complex dihydrolipoamide acetyltransferase [Acidocella sp.]|uniref:pyruvate dehydrogenase complex dihydrolipoamide acetyltransferase n=1 Tax=Acidocella sp. TaxID=50710 RepID=UPI0026034BE0|nr:pyruvate dehydrogenase complex dihydrolipoamide acetyltransferase [Acidocella sp.]
MAINILMPALSPTMTEGKLAKWLKQEGDEIKSGDVIAEIETDKATMEVEAADEGFLAKIVVPEGSEGIAVNTVIGVITAEKAEIADSPAAAPAAKTPALKEEPKAAAPTTTPSGGGHGTAHGERIVASPLARRIAKQNGLDLATIKGSGPNGRIVRADVEGAQTSAKATQPIASVSLPTPAQAKPTASTRTAPAPASTAPAITAPHTKVPNSTMRKVIAKRLTESKQEVPNFYVTAHVEIDKLLALRTELNNKSPKEGPGAFKLSVNDLVIKACAIALRRHPNVNASWTEEAIIQYHDVDISVAVSIPEGLITPIIRKADQLGLAAISNNMKDLAGRAKTGKLKPEEFQGGTFSISNLGMYGTAEFTAIINPPQAGILAIGAGTKRPVVKDDEIKIATVMSITMSADHRVMDGAGAAEFVQTVKGLLEEPLGLLL